MINPMLTSNKSLNQRGLSQIVLLLILVIGLVGGVYAVQKARTVLNPHADEGDSQYTGSAADVAMQSRPSGRLMASAVASCEPLNDGVQKINVKWEDVHANSYSVNVLRLRQGKVYEINPSAAWSGCLPKGTLSYNVPGLLESTGYHTYEAVVSAYTSDKCDDGSVSPKAEIALIENDACKVSTAPVNPAPARPANNNQYGEN